MHFIHVFKQHEVHRGDALHEGHAFANNQLQHGLAVDVRACILNSSQRENTENKTEQNRTEEDRTWQNELGADSGGRVRNAPRVHMEAVGEQEDGIV